MEDGAPRNAGRRPIEKARGRFPGAGFIFDIEFMQVICPTGQELFLRAAADLLADAFHSNP
jgi:hypothetical protein